VGRGGWSEPGYKKKIGTPQNIGAEPLFEEDKPYYVL
jgi:hypothetical protein